MEKYYPKADVVPQTLTDLLGEPLRPATRPAKRNKKKAKAQRAARKRNR